MSILANDSFTGADNSAPDSAKWDIGNLLSLPNGGTPKITSNQLDLRTPGSAICGITSKNAFNVTGGGVLVKVAAVGTGSGTDTYLYLHSSGAVGSTTPRHNMVAENGLLYVQDSNSYSFSRTYDPVADLYWRLQEAGGNIQAYTSPSGAAGSWVAIGASRPSAISPSSVKAVLASGGQTASTSALFDDFQADDSPISTAALAAPAVAAIVSAVPDGRIFKHNGTSWSASTTGSIVESGTYSNFTPNQIRLVRDGTNTALAGFDWATISVASAGNYSHTFASVPQGIGTGWYNVQLRDSAIPATILATGKRGVGIHIGHYGQSQSSNQFENFPLVGAALTPTGMSRVHGGQGGGTVWNWAALDPTKNSAIVAADILLNSLTGGNIPIAFLNMGYPGTSLVRGGPNGNWLPTSGSLYQYGRTLLAGLEGSVTAMVDIRGESDANNGTVTQAEFYAGLGTLYAQTRTDCGNANLPIVQVILGETSSAYWADASGEAIRKAQVQKFADANIYRVESYDAPLHSDGLHRNTTGCEMVARRWAMAVAKILGLASGYRAPRITSVGSVNSTTFDAVVSYDDGSTDFTPTSGLTGFRITDSVSGAVLTASSVTRQSSSLVRFFLSAAPANLPKFGTAYGATAGPNFVGNGALAQPLEYDPGIVAGAAYATTVTFPVKDLITGVDITGLTNLDYAIFDQARFNSLAAPIKKGATLSVSGGSATIDITGLTTLVPGGSALVLAGPSSGLKAIVGQVVVS